MILVVLLIVACVQVDSTHNPNTLVVHCVQLDLTNPTLVPPFVCRVSQVNIKMQKEQIFAIYVPKTHIQRIKTVQVRVLRVHLVDFLYRQAV
jgi:hypothetical protein